MKRCCKAKFFALLNSSICHSADQVRADIHGLVLRRFYLKMHVVVHEFVAYQADFQLFAESVQRLYEPVFVVVVLKNILLVDASHDDVIDAKL